MTNIVTDGSVSFRGEDALEATDGLGVAQAMQSPVVPGGRQPLKGEMVEFPDYPASQS
jgi:hypothetical protein